MPYSTPGRIKYVTNGATAVKHGFPARVGNVCGAAIKQRSVAFDAALAAQAVIAASEPFAVVAKGVVEHDTVDASGSAIAALVQGDPVFITPANVLATGSASGANLAYGRVHETTSMSRGVPVGKIRIDLDARDSI